MKRFLGLWIFCLAIISTFAYSRNELLRLDFLPEYSVINSSCFGEDSGVLLINPAGLYRVNRINAMFSSGSGLNVNFLGLSTMMPLIGGVVAVDLYNTVDENGLLKRGLALGWGNDFFGFSSFGFSLKTVSRENILDFSNGALFDIGLILFPNESLGIDFFKNKFINNRLFLSLVVQNLGNRVFADAGEQMNIRVGLGYKLEELWTKFFVEKFFLSDGNSLYLGAELRPTIDFLDIFSLRVSTDLSNVRLGAGIHGRDAGVDFSYCMQTKEFYFSFTGYFEKDRSELSKEYYDDGLNYYNQAKEVERDKEDVAFDKYRLAYNNFSKAYDLDKNNKKAAYMKTKIEEKMESYKTTYVNNAVNAESKNDYVSALVYYNKAYQVEKDSSINEKILQLSKNETVVSHVNNKKQIIRSNLKAKKYLVARREAEKLLRVIPGDKETQELFEDAASNLKSVAEDYYKKAQNFYDKGMYEECIAQAKKALIYDPEMEKANDLIALASSEITEKRGIQRANDLYKQKNYLGAYRIVNWLLSKNENNKEAANLRAKILRALKDSVKVNLDRGIGFYNNSEYDKAIEEFDKVLLVDSTNSIATDYRNRALSKQKALEKLEQIEE